MTARSSRGRRWDLNLNNLPADNAAFEGDAVYLMDNAGPSAPATCAAWFPYPCNPDSAATCCPERSP